MREQPEQTYYPSAKVRIVIRFDDFAQPGTPKPPKKPPQLRGGKANKPELEVQTIDGKLVLASKLDTDATKGGPQKQTTSKDKRTHVIEGIIPAHIALQRNGIRTADTCTVEIKFIDMPIDPRVVRAAAIEVYLGTLSQEEFELGVKGLTRGDRAAGADNASEPLNVVPDSFLDDANNQRSNRRFSGWVDEWVVEWPDEGEPVVTLECTDNTRLLIEQDAPPKLTVSADTPIDRAIADYLANFPQFRGLAVEYRPAGGDIPKLKDSMAKTAFKPKLGPPPSGGGTSKLTVWDYLTDVCGTVGHTLRLEEEVVVIQRARTLYSGQFSGRPDDPFTGRELPSGREILNRLFIYGRNIKEMSFKRKFARFAPFNVEVRCYSGKRKKTLVQRYPMKEDRQKRLLPGDAADEKWTVFRVQGIEDEKVLRIVAQGIYESVGRNELEAHLQTKNLASFGGGNLDPDALDLEAGDAIDIEVNREIEGLSTIAGAEDQIAKNAEAFMRAIGYTGDFAKAYAEAVGNVGFPTTFRVRSVCFDWDAQDEGIVIDIEATNYIEVRADKLLPEGEEITTEETAGKSPVKVKVEDL